MIVASHQPNFMPYMGFFYKMHMCDIFTLSDTVQFSRQGFHNYNFVMLSNGDISKLTVPVSNHSGAICDVELSQWEHNRKKIWRRLCTEYCHAPHFKEFRDLFEEVFTKDYNLMCDLNIELLSIFHNVFGFDCKLIRESDLHVVGYSATQQIADICKKTGCGTYLSGIGAVEYLDVNHLNENGITVKWSDYKPLQAANTSAFDYLMRHGATIPDEWKKEKEGFLNG